MNRKLRSMSLGLRVARDWHRLIGIARYWDRRRVAGIARCALGLCVARDWRRLTSRVTEPTFDADACVCRVTGIARYWRRNLFNSFDVLGGIWGAGRPSEKKSRGVWLCCSCRVHGHRV